MRPEENQGLRNDEVPKTNTTRKTVFERNVDITGPIRKSRKSEVEFTIEESLGNLPVRSP